MKIAFYKDTFANNRGADIAVKNLAAGLAERGHSVTLFTNPELAEKVHGKYDVLISAGTNEIRDLMKFSNLPPIVQQFHTDVSYPFRHWIKRWKRNRAIKQALKCAALFQVLVQTHVAKLQQLFGGVTSRKIAVVGNWSAYENSEIPNQPSQKIILYPGAINKDKNQALLVKAFAEVADDFPEWQVHLYGKGSPQATKLLQRVIARRGLSDRILLKGHADFSKPSLMTRDWIGCGAVSTEKGFATALRKLISDEGYRMRLGREARDYCRAHYSRERILPKWEETLLAVLDV